MTTWLYAPVWLGRTETPGRAVLQPLEWKPDKFSRFNRYGRGYAKREASSNKWEFGEWIGSATNPIAVARRLGTHGLTCLAAAGAGSDNWHLDAWDSHVPAALARAERLTTELDALEWPTTPGAIAKPRPSLTEVWLTGLGGVGALCWRCGDADARRLVGASLTSPICDGCFNKRQPWEERGWTP